MPQVTLRKRKPEHQNRVSKLIPRTGENHHTDPKKKPIKGKPYSHAEKAGRGKKKRANEDQTSRTHTQDDWKRKSQAYLETRPQKLRQANKKRVHIPWWKRSWRTKESHWSCGKEAPKRDNSDGGGRRRGPACVRARASERIEREGDAAEVGFWPNPKP